MPRTFAWMLADYLGNHGDWPRYVVVKTWPFEFKWSIPLTDEQVEAAVWAWRHYQVEIKFRLFVPAPNKWATFPKRAPTGQPPGNPAFRTPGAAAEHKKRCQWEKRRIIEANGGDREWRLKRRRADDKRYRKEGRKIDIPYGLKPRPSPKASAS